MAISKEIWLPAIEGNFFSEWDVLTRLGKDDSMYVQNATVHIPNAGAAGTLKKNNSTFPVSVTERTDNDNSYDIDSFQMPPIRIGAFDQNELSYDKSLSVVQDQTGRLGEYVKFDIFTTWYPDKVEGNYVETSDTGNTATSEAPASTAVTKGLSIEDVKNAKRILDVDKVPTSDRVLLLPPLMFDQLHTSVIDNFTINDNDGMLMFDKPLFGFDVIMQPEVINVESDGTLREYGHTGDTTDLQVGLAYQKDQVSFAKGNVQVYESEKDALYYGDVISAEAWASGKYRRYDKKGVVPIIQDTV